MASVKQVLDPEKQAVLKKAKKKAGLAIRVRRVTVEVSQTDGYYYSMEMAQELGNEKAVISQGMWSDIENGVTSPLDIGAIRFFVMLDVLKWSIQEFQVTTELLLPPRFMTGDTDALTIRHAVDIPNMIKGDSSVFVPFLFVNSVGLSNTSAIEVKRVAVLPSSQELVGGFSHYLINTSESVEGHQLCTLGNDYFVTQKPAAPYVPLGQVFRGTLDASF